MMEDLSRDQIISTLARLDESPDLDRPFFWRWYSTRRLFSNFVWDLHSAHAYAFFRNKSKQRSPPVISQKGYVTGALSPELASKFEALFDRCEKTEFSGSDFAEGFFFEPRKSVHEYFNRTNSYYKVSSELESELNRFLTEMAEEIERCCGHFWKVGSVRLFTLKSGFNSGAVHLDGWPLAMKKLFIYPRGANTAKGTTYIRTRDGHETTIESEQGLWMLFENSIVEHQAILPKEETSKPRQTIEIDLVPSFRTEAKLIHSGVNGWYPWFPVDRTESEDEVLEEFKWHRLQERLLTRIGGLALELPPKDYSLKLDDFLPPPEEELGMNSNFIKVEKPVLSAPVAPEVPPFPWRVKNAIRHRLGTIKRRILQ
jgi:hypothetical protein